MPVAAGPWALDSGGFTELNLQHGWVTTEKQYLRDVRRFKDEIGNMLWASPQDWMCEPWMNEKTGLSVAEHQRLTVENFINLRSQEETIIPVLQGWERDEYLRHVEMYANHGVDLFAEPIVGLGSVCRRQGMNEARDIVWSLSSLGLKLHGYGFKMGGLKNFGFDLLTSADSMAWSFTARRQQIQLPGCTHKTCTNCLRWALQWRDELLGKRKPVQQLALGVAS